MRSVTRMAERKGPQKVGWWGASKVEQKERQWAVQSATLRAGCSASKKVVRKENTWAGWSDQQLAVMLSLIHI